MRIGSVTLRNFRCFGPESVTISLGDLTAIVGANGCGKSAVLLALTRLFGVTSAERALGRDDVHVPSGKSLEEVGETDLFIEARLDFPELDSEVVAVAGAAALAAADADAGPAVAECFNQMIVDAEGQAPYCRIRLQGRWSPSSLPDGSVDQELLWLTTDAEEPDEASKRPVRGADRSRIQVHYVPATRDPAKHVRHAAGSILHHLLRAVRWSPEVQKEVERAADDVSDKFEAEAGVQELTAALQANWAALHGSRALKEVAIRPVARRFDELLKRVETIFTPGPDGREYSIDRLSDGLRSLFYLSIVAASFDIYEQAHAPRAVPAAEPGDGDAAAEMEGPFLVDELNAPTLSLFAIEEPENHLAPHYLGRIMTLLRKMANAARGQVLLTSHSASILRRVKPEEVRHLRLDEASETTVVRAVTLPKVGGDAHKYVREAVVAHPELYFARFVVLCEGDSEVAVLPRLSEAMGLPIDPSFVSVVPLGGRHVNHFWRLLTSLAIPHVTLLDLDLERAGGGWGRIKYACEQLLANGTPRNKLLALEADAVLSDERLAGMHGWPIDTVENRTALVSWVKRLEEYGVYYSTPLDLDFLMLGAFETEYKAVATRGPSIPSDPEKYAAALEKVFSAVLKESHTGGASYNDADRKLLFWYRNLFLSRDKPTTHLLALADLSDEDLSRRGPEVLRRLIDHMKAQLAVTESVEEVACAPA